MAVDDERTVRLPDRRPAAGVGAVAPPRHLAVVAPPVPDPPPGPAVKPRNAGPQQQHSPVRAGDQRDAGQVHAALIVDRKGRDRMAFNVAHLGGMTVDVSLEDAEEFYHGVGRMLGLE